MKKILFLHGFFASGQCVPAVALRESLDGIAEVYSPDLPIHPEAAIDFVRDLCGTLHPDVIVGNSNGSFIAQITASELKIPALLGNPHFQMTKFLSDRIGRHQYKSPRTDGRQDFTIDGELISEFERVEKRQFSGCTEEMNDRIWGLFGDNDTLAHYEDIFLEHYSRAFHFPGNHTPTADEVRMWYVPLVKQLMEL